MPVTTKQLTLINFVVASFALLVSCASGGGSSDNNAVSRTDVEESETWSVAHNPLIWADVPDPSVIRVGDTYYMSSTTMHMNPGLPIMKSRDLVNWTLASYAYETLADTDALSLSHGEEAYGEGSWASSLRYHNGRYYVSTFSNTTQKTYIFSTEDIDNGPWHRAEIDGLYHDASLVFDRGRAFLIYGNNDIDLIELTPEADAIKPGGLNTTLIEKASKIAGEEFWVPSEGAQVRKINDYYYINLISWPANGQRTQLVYRAKTLFGPYEGRVVLADQGVAQGGLIDTPDGEWYALLFGDRGAVGRIPYLVPVHWENNWPVFGVNGRVPETLPIRVQSQTLNNIVSSDEFDYQQGEPLHLAWQWNHNPVAEGWSVTRRPGFLTLTSVRRDDSFVATRNTLTQRTFGPTSSAETRLMTGGMRSGDYAGLGLLQADYAFVGVEQQGDTRAVVMAKGDPEQWEVVERVPLNRRQVYLKIEADFRDQNDQAVFSYSLDGENWRPIGEPLAMEYTLTHFMGARFGLFQFGTQQSGGRADFDYYRLSN